MINLYILDESSRGSIYGIGSYIRELTNALKDCDINLHVIHLRSKEQNLAESSLIHHYYIPSPIRWNNSIDWDKQNDIYYQNVVYILRLIIKNNKKIIFHLNYNSSSKLVEELRRRFNCKIITTIHYFDWSFLLSGNISYLKLILSSSKSEHNSTLNRLIMKSLNTEKKIFKIVDHIICLSKNTKSILLNEYQINTEKITVIYNGLNYINKNCNAIILRRKFYYNKNKIILFVGRIDDIKGLKYAIQAFKIVLKTYRNCHLIIAGEGNFSIYMKECEDIWSHITWTGLISKEKLFELYSIADIGVMPSFHEQCSFVAIEMMMHGIPLIASTSTGLKEMVEEGITGLHIPVIEYPNKIEIDTSLLAEKILYLLQHYNERKRMGKNAQKRYRNLYSINIFREKMINLYNSLF